MLNTWYKRCFRRILVDMHIPDWDKRFFSKLDAKSYVDTVARGGCSSTMLYCNSHVGLALYPSEVGPVHAGLRKKDFVGDAVAGFHRKNVAVVAYYSAVFNNVAFLEHPDWRIKPIEGPRVYKRTRYGVCCPNSPYHRFAVEQTEEFCRRYEFDGVFFDMLFWPYVCYCRHCRARFKKEHGGELPTVIDWNNPVWMAFQRARECWMNEMAGSLTAAVRRSRPSMTVTHQMSPVLHGWQLAMPYAMTEHCDYTSGDFYGPAAQQSLACKIFEAISVLRPFEFHTSRCVDLRDHVTLKSTTRLETQASLAPAHASAFMFIDAVDPVGTLNRGVYDRLGEVFSRLKPYERYLGGSLSAQVAIYVSSESRFNFRQNGLPIITLTKPADNMAPRFSLPHMDAVMGAARSLQEAHIPFAVATKMDLARLDRYRVILLPDVLVMSDEEVHAFRDFVARGGRLYASGHSSLVSDDGRVRKDFGLADVFGVSNVGMMNQGLAFFTPADSALAKLIAPQGHVIHNGGRIALRRRKAKPLATVTLPYTPENGGMVSKPSFASIHSNPPGPVGDVPGLVWNKYGKGLACYAAGAIEAEAQPINRRIVAHLVGRLFGGTPRIEAEAPPFVEITVYDKPDEGRLNISLVSLRESDDRQPCNGSVTVRLDKGRRFVALRSLPDLKALPCRRLTSAAIRFEFRALDIFQMFELEYATAKTKRR